MDVMNGLQCISTKALNATVNPLNTNPQAAVMQSGHKGSKTGSMHLTRSRVQLYKVLEGSIMRW